MLEPKVLRKTAPAAVLLALALPSCGENKTENRIKPLVATLTIDPFTGVPDPAVYLERDPSSRDDFAVVNVRLHATTPFAFDAWTLELTYDFQLIQIGDVFAVNPALLGDCTGGLSCSPVCESNAAQANAGQNVDSEGKAHFVMGVAAKAGCPIARSGQCSLTTGTRCVADADCPSGETCGSPDVTLATLAFIAATFNDDPAAGRIKIVTGSGRGDCEILSDVTDLGIPCVDGNASLTASR